MSGRIVGAILIAMFGVLCFGLGSVGGESYDQPTNTVIVPKEVTKTVVRDKVVVRLEQPKACQDMAVAARRVLAATAAYEGVLGRETRVQEESYHASNGGTQAERNKVSEDHRGIISDTLDAALELQEAQKDLRTADLKCRKYPVK